MAQISERMGMYRRIGFALLLGAVPFVSAGCFGVVPTTTENYVRDEIRQANAPIQAKLAQLETTVAQQKTALEQVNARVTQVDGRVSQVATQVTEARKVADEGVQKAGAVDERLTRVLAIA